MKSQPKRAFHMASEPEIKAGEVSDVYFERTVEILRAKGLNKRVKAEIRLKSFPQTDWTFGVLAGIDAAAAAGFASLKIDSVVIRGVNDGNASTRNLSTVPYRPSPTTCTARPCTMSAGVAPGLPSLRKWIWSSPERARPVSCGMFMPQA